MEIRLENVEECERSVGEVHAANLTRRYGEPVSAEQAERDYQAWLQKRGGTSFHLWSGDELLGSASYSPSKRIDDACDVGWILYGEYETPKVAAEVLRLMLDVVRETGCELVASNISKKDREFAEVVEESLWREYTDDFRDFEGFVVPVVAMRAAACAEGAVS